MHHFFVPQEAVEETRITVTGPDVNHIKNVLRMRPGEEVLITTKDGEDFLCRIASVEEKAVEAQILSRQEGKELPLDLYLFQGLPKGDKMELIIQKAVELGVYKVIPVMTQNTVVKLDQKKEQAKLRRWQAVSESAAKQSKRSRIPEIGGVASFSEALRQASFLDRIWIPYERADGMETLKKELEAIGSGVRSIGIFIGPEGGFQEKEVEEAEKAGACAISLGKRILRTETAGMAVLSLLMLKAEGAF